MRRRTDRGQSRMTRSSRTAGALPLILLACGGCGLLPFPTNIAGLVQGAADPQGTRILASVTTTNPDTGLPVHLSGTITGESTGTYEEEILEVYFDADGVPLAALSRSIATFSSPEIGTITTLNLIIVVDFIFAIDDLGAPMLDDQGAPIVIGLVTASAGEIITGTGAFEGMTGQLHSDSVLMLIGGDFDLGIVDSELVLTLEAPQAAGEAK